MHSALPKSPSRRQFAIAISLATIGPMPLVTRAQVLEGCAAVVGIIAGISGMSDSASMKSTLRTIARRLSEIIANQQVIIKEMRELKLLVVETAFISWRDAYARRLTTYDRQLQILISDLEAAKYKVEGRLKSDFEVLSRDCFVTTDEIGQMDVWAFPSFATGVATVLLADRVLGTSVERTKKTKEKFVERITKWLDASFEASLPAIIQRTKAEVAKRTADLQGRGRTYVTADGWEIKGRCHRKAKTTLTVSGSFEQGFAGSQVTVADKYWVCEDIDMPSSVELPLATYSIDNPGILARPMGAGPDVDAAVPIPVVPGFNPSGHAIVDDFNRERIAIYELMVVNSKQEILHTQMTDLKKLLTA